MLLDTSTTVDMSVKVRFCLEKMSHQLLLYERMAFKLDPNFKPYKLYRLVCIHNNVKQVSISSTLNAKKFVQNVVSAAFL